VVFTGVIVDIVHYYRVWWQQERMTCGSAPSYRQGVYCKSLTKGAAQLLFLYMGGSCVNVQRITPIVVSKIENLVSLLSFALDVVAFVDATSLLDKNNNVTTGKLLDK